MGYLLIFHLVLILAAPVLQSHWQMMSLYTNLFIFSWIYENKIETWLLVGIRQPP